ncbi:MAG: hypothetical protein KC635_24780 [Myxococcales bacterium]|nr:hypothetical protein [Myxococcales bacterium]MCB9734822.1 hypothetical protein [Deltaproteobacteria bacterium]
MCRASALLLAATVAVVALGGCAVSLDDEAPDTSAAPDAPLLASCPVAASGAVAGATGRVQAVSLPDGSVLAVLGAVQHGSGSPTEAASVVHLATANTLGACGEGLAAADDAGGGVDVTALDSDAAGTALGVWVEPGEGAVHAFVSVARGFDVLGTGLATLDRATGRFIAGAGYLFAGDGRPSYGDAALVAGGYVYAYGCAASGFLAEDCFVARAPVADAGDRTAWRYFRDGGDFGADPDDAWPLFSGGSGLAVAQVGPRVVVAHATPLGDTVLLRTGLGPTGPWSPAAPTTRCEVPAGAFCGALAFVAPLADAGELALTYAVASFEPLDAAARRTRLVRLSAP